MSVCLHLYLCNMCLPGAYGGQKRTANPLDQMIVHHHVDAENQSLKENLIDLKTERGAEQCCPNLGLPRAKREFPTGRQPGCPLIPAVPREMYKALKSRKAQTPFLPQPSHTRRAREPQ